MSRQARMQYRVPYADTDRMGFVYYANYLIYFEMARTQLLLDMGLPYSKMETGGFALPVVEAHVDYRAPAGYEDMIDVLAWVGWIKGVRLQVKCEVRRDGQLLASGYTVHACMDLKTRRPVRVLPELVERSGPYSEAVAADAATGTGG